MTYTTEKGYTYELRGGEWLNEENKCFYDVIGAIGTQGYYLCRDVLDRGFVLYMPNYNKILPRID